MAYVKNIDKQYRNKAGNSHNVHMAGEQAAIAGAEKRPEPWEILQASLGACISVTLLDHARQKGFPVNSIDVKVNIHFDDNMGYSFISQNIVIDGAIADKQRSELMELADSSYIHKILSFPAIVKTNMA